VHLLVPLDMYLVGQFVAPFRDKSMFWHNVWMQYGRPVSGYVADIMRSARHAYHYAVRRVRRMETDIVNDRFAKVL
jgi:hypothetical protein